MRILEKMITQMTLTVEDSGVNYNSITLTVEDSGVDNSSNDIDL